jgi:tetratricopeptide (TPR) repeat protein
MIEARILELSASLAVRSGSPGLALQPLRRSIYIRRRMGGEGLAAALAQLADVHSELDQPLEALEISNQAIAVLDPRDEELRLVVMTNGAEFLCEMGRHLEALRAIQNIEGLYSRVSQPNFEACRDLTLAHIHEGLGHLDLADKHYRLAISAFQALGDDAKALGAMIERSKLA